MHYTLKELKNALYTGAQPALYLRGGSVSEQEFMDLLFSSDFYSGTFEDENGDPVSLKTMLSEETGGGKSQRNKVFKGQYSGFTLETSVIKVLQLRPDLLKKLCGKCADEIRKAENDDALRGLLGEINSDEIYGTSLPYHQFVSSALEHEVPLAMAAVIMYLLLQGQVGRFLPILESSRLFSGQFDYMEQTIPRLKQTFEIESADEHFEAALGRFWDPFARLLSHVTTVEKAGEKIGYEHLLNGLYQAVLDARESKNPKILRIRGVAGSDKNAITQLLYLRLACDVRSGEEDDYAPFYVNLNHYTSEHYPEQEDAKSSLERDAAPFLKFCASHPQRIPILFVDGVKKYNLGDYNLDFFLYDLIKPLSSIRYVVAIEDGSVINSRRQRVAANFASGGFSYTVRMESLYLSGREEARSYLNEFTQIYGGGSPEKIYEHLRKMGFNCIDTYQLRLCLGRDLDLLSRADNLAHLYQLICSEELGGEQEQLALGEQWAFDFAYTGEPLPEISGALKRLLSAHDSMQEFFIARWYLSRIREGSLSKDQLNMVMPKGVTRFVVPMLNRSVGDENRVLNLIEQEYAGMGLMAQSEMTYWLGRIKSESLAKRAERMLLRYYEDQKEKTKGMAPTGVKYRNSFFLLRGIAVSLIVIGHVDVSEEYITSLIQNDTANEINRGFHLEYYGDKPYLPVYDTLTLLDDITVGKRTLDHLITANEQSIGSENLPHIFDLNLFTICSLLQARVETPNPNITFDLKDYLEKACRQIEWYLLNNRSFPIFCEYLEMVQGDFQTRLESEETEWNTLAAETYTKYTKRICRTGWVERGVREPETDAEHMYHAWMLAMMFLPKTLPDYPEYSKEKILNLLLIHDVAEAITGDIPRPEKTESTENYEYHKQEEEKQMAIFLLRGSYPGMSNLPPEFYDIWKMWYDQGSINGCIAGEVDLIQTMYQMLTYATTQPDCFRDDDVRRWMRDRAEIRTAPGVSILNSVVLKNKDFEEILTRLGIIGQQ